MFREGKAHLLGSDAHNLSSRAPNLEKARAVLSKKLGGEALSRIDKTGVKLFGFGSAGESADMKGE
jgi:protein-tyrosine phosphatase